MSSAMQVSKRPSQMDKPSPVPHTRVDDESVIENKFSMGKRLGQGSFGIVREAVDLGSGRKWAVKAVNKEKAGSSAVKLLEREVSILKSVNHDHIIHLEQVFETSKKMYLVMELCEHGELADMLKTQQYFREDEVRKIIRDLASAISYLHKNDIVHRDLKLENILVHKNEDSNDLHIKVTDFGLSVVKDGVGHENMMQQFCGTPIYMPPEIVDNKTYSQQCDVWAMGVITYYLLSGLPPFKARDEDTLYEYIKKGEIDFKEPRIRDCSGAAHQCIQGMLKVDPAHRLTASEVLNHHWITGAINGNATGNVLELMKQWKDELHVDVDDEACDSTPLAQTDTSDSIDLTPGSNPSLKTLTGRSPTTHSPSRKGNNKPRSAGSRPLFSGNHSNKASYNPTNHKPPTNRVQQLSNQSTLSVTTGTTPLRRRPSPTYIQSEHQTTSTPIVVVNVTPLMDSSGSPPGTESNTNRDGSARNSAGKRTTTIASSSNSVSKSNTNLSKKTERSPPSSSTPIKTTTNRK